MKIELRNLQTIRKPRRRQILKFIHFLLHRAQKMAPEPRWGTISFVLVDNDEVRRLNAIYLHRDKTTDVIAFRYQPLPNGAGMADGEIIINVERAVEVGPRWGGVDREFALYLAHGCDHLAGADDATSTQRDRMRRRELRWLRQAGVHGITIRLVQD